MEELYWRLIKQLNYNNIDDIKDILGIVNMLQNKYGIIITIEFNGKEYIPYVRTIENISIGTHRIITKSNNIKECYKKIIILYLCTIVKEICPNEYNKLYKSYFPKDVVSCCKDNHTEFDINYEKDKLNYGKDLLYDNITETFNNFHKDILLIKDKELIELNLSNPLLC